MANAKDGKPMNGSSRMRILAPAAALSMPYDDPLTKVFGLDAQSTGIGAWVGYFLGAFAFLLGLAVTARAMTVIFASHGPPPPPPAPQEIDIVAPEAPPPPPAPPAPEPEVKNEPPPAHPAPHEATPPPAPAQAGKVLTQEPDPNEPVDLTGNTIISGNADSFAGGVTAANGTSKTAVRGLTSPTGAPAALAAPPAAAPAGPDRSRTPSMADRSAWLNAPFPREADDAQIDNAEVTLQINVRPDGSIDVPAVLKDPGYGFGREAVKFAMKQKYAPALDHDGNAIPASFRTIVRYSR
ncbi:MAG TPA: energy transducer TonB [Polyangiaceae bacterium]|jgi:protein TonB|nr:energy transducer TonB [Polyangiaceae bacterium]